MAGLAANVDDQWRESIRHLRDIARENEERLETNRELVGRLAIITPALTDGHARAVPELDARAARFQDELHRRSRELDDRFGRIGESREDAVSFRDLGHAAGDGFDDAENDPSAEGDPARRRGWLLMTKAQRRAAAERRALRAVGILGVIERDAAADAASERREKNPARRGRNAAGSEPARRDPVARGASFGNGKAAAAARRAQERRAAFVAEVAATRAAEAEAETNRAREKARLAREAAEDAENNTAKSRAARAAASEAKAVPSGRAVRFGLRVATAEEDTSDEAVKSRAADEAARAAADAVVAAAESLEAREREFAAADATAKKTRASLADAEAAAAEADGMARRAEEIVADLIADGQEDAAACAMRTVEAWRARSADVLARAASLRSRRVHDDGARDETRRLVADAARVFREGTETRAVLAETADEARADADAAREARAAMTAATTRRVLAGLERARRRRRTGREKRRMENERRRGGSRRARRRRSIGRRAVVRARRGDGREEGGGRRERRRRGARVADAASSRLDARVAAFAAAVVAADAARETLRVVAVDACESSAPGGDREMTLTLDVAAPVGRRLVAVVGPATALSAYDERVQLRTLRPGLRLVVAAPRGRGTRESPRTTTLADLLLEAVPLAPRVEEKFQDDDDREGPRPGSLGSAMKTARFAKGAARRARALAEKESGSRLGSGSSGSGSSGSRSGGRRRGRGRGREPTLPLMTLPLMTL